ncbi:MAG: monovalent cation/H(+) antiporter subunit G [Paracoccaceae bacterium]
MAVLADALAWICLIAGTVFFLVGAIGINRMPDVFTRMHAASVSETLGVGLLILGMLIEAGFSLVSAKLLVIWGLVTLAGPVATHALARAALHDGRKPLLDRDGRLEETDPVALFPELGPRLTQPKVSETLAPAAGVGDTYGAEAPGAAGDLVEGRATPSNS